MHGRNVVFESIILHFTVSATLLGVARVAMSKTERKQLFQCSQTRPHSSGA